MKIGDKVRVIKSVWDDHRESDWKFYIGYIRAESPGPLTEKISWYVEFPGVISKYNSFDFYEDELEIIND